MKVIYYRLHAIMLPLVGQSQCGYSWRFAIRLEIPDSQDLSEHFGGTARSNIRRKGNKAIGDYFNYFNSIHSTNTFTHKCIQILHIRLFSSQRYQSFSTTAKLKPISTRNSRTSTNTFLKPLVSPSCSHKMYHTI